MAVRTETRQVRHCLVCMHERLRVGKSKCNEVAWHGTGNQTSMMHACKQHLTGSGHLQGTELRCRCCWKDSCSLQHPRNFSTFSQG